MRRTPRSRVQTTRCARCSTPRAGSTHCWSATRSSSARTTDRLASSARRPCTTRSSASTSSSSRHRTAPGWSTTSAAAARASSPQRLDGDPAAETVLFLENGELVARRDGGEGLDVLADYPDGLARATAALRNPNSGDVLVSAAPGYEFTDLAGRHHAGGGSHGSLLGGRLGGSGAHDRARSRAREHHRDRAAPARPARPGAPGVRARAQPCLTARKSGA